MSSSDKNFVQYISRVAVEVVPPASSSCSLSSTSSSSVVLPSLPIFAPTLLHYGQLDFVSTRILLPLEDPSIPSPIPPPPPTTIIAGSFRNFPQQGKVYHGYRNIAVMKDGQWRGVGASNG